MDPAVYRPRCICREGLEEHDHQISTLLPFPHNETETALFVRPMVGPLGLWADAGLNQYTLSSVNTIVRPIRAILQSWHLLFCILPTVLGCVCISFNNVYVLVCV